METVTCDEMREIDRRAVEILGVPPIILMENAGRSLADVFLREISVFGQGAERTRILLLAGRGNNGGDGFVLARRLAIAGILTETVILGKPENYREEAAIELTILRNLAESKTAVKPIVWDFDDTEESFVRLERSLRMASGVVDALLGTGAKGNPRPPFDRIIRAVNKTGKAVLALDLPSGLDGDTGIPGDPTIRAIRTVTLAAMKNGLIVETARPYVGRLEVGDIGVPRDFF